MSYQDITFEVAGRIATITLNRPDKLNAWTLQMEHDYRAAMAESERRDDVRVIVVTGAGKGFCAGADMGLLQSIQSGEMDLSAGTHRVLDEQGPASGVDVRDDFKKPYSFPPGIQKPVIGAINGVAVGIGLVHALYCDIRFSADTARYGTAFAQRGLIAEHGLCWLLPRLIGMENALDLLFSARLINGIEAKELGLVSRVYTADTLMDEVYAYATHLATQCSPRSLAIIKKQAWESQFRGLGEACDVAIQEMFNSFGSADFLEGVASFMEKRAPQFTGK
ncbi:MAG: enoyl-CoA hydratase [Candidatus Hydrogenedentes bacterium]|nr:enoyl-CoA hydratase [Candidatus Hydrogenedentota bacterium]